MAFPGALENIDLYGETEGMHRITTLDELALAAVQAESCLLGQRGREQMALSLKDPATSYIGNARGYARFMLATVHHQGDSSCRAWLLDVVLADVVNHYLFLCAAEKEQALRDRRPIIINEKMLRALGGEPRGFARELFVEPIASPICRHRYDRQQEGVFYELVPGRSMLEHLCARAAGLLAVRHSKV